VSVIVIVADGVRPDTLRAALDKGALPALNDLRADGGLFTVTTCAPSVTGPAYTPFLLGRYPAPVGLPGLRWYDRSRRVCKLPGNSRSYVGWEVGAVDQDLDSDAPTIFELTRSSIAAFSPIARGLKKGAHVGKTVALALRMGIAHFRGDVRGTISIDRDIAREFAERVIAEQPEFAFAALTGVDKASHATGHDSSFVLGALRIIDALVAELRSELGTTAHWQKTHLWVVSDHGHSRVQDHEDLVRLLRDWGFHPRAHPWAYTWRGNVAVMVSGNSLAHLYLDLESRVRRWWPELALHGEPLVQQLLTRDSVDLVALPHSAARIEIRSRRRGSAMLDARQGRYTYVPRTGDPLGIGNMKDLDDDAAHAVTAGCDYPDALVQIAALATAERSGDVIISASRDWDFRARYEPIPHVSSHGALHRDHMLVPLLLNRPPRRAPRRTADVFPSALAALGVRAPPGLDGESYL
jgi:arylsulfatase A-like enzyme